MIFTVLDSPAVYSTILLYFSLFFVSLRGKDARGVWQKDQYVRSCIQKKFELKLSELKQKLNKKKSFIPGNFHNNIMLFLSIENTGKKKKKEEPQHFYSR